MSQLIGRGITLFTYEERKQLLEAVRYAMGDDREGKFDFLREQGVEAVYLLRAHGKTTEWLGSSSPFRGTCNAA